MKHSIDNFILYFTRYKNALVSCHLRKYLPLQYYNEYAIFIKMFYSSFMIKFPLYYKADTIILLFLFTCYFYRNIYGMLLYHCTSYLKKKQNI